MTKIYSNIVKKRTLRGVQRQVLETLAESLANSFGPSGSTTCYRKEKDIARYTKDGKTIIENINFNGPIEDSMKDDITAITRRIVTTVGDGTTSAVLLSNFIFQSLCVANEFLGIDEHKLTADLKATISKICELIEQRKRIATVDDIYNIAYISTNGNEFIANIIKEIYEKGGFGVFIDVGTSNSENTITKTYDGFTINEGLCSESFMNTNEHTSDLRSPKIYIFEDPIDSIEMSSFMDKIIYDNIISPNQNGCASDIVPTVIFAPKIGKDIMTSMDSLVEMMNRYKTSDRSRYLPINVVTNVNDLNYFMDLAYLSGAKLIKKYIDPAQQKKDQEAGLAPTLETIHDFAGSADEIISDTSKTKIINPALMHNEDGSLSDIYTNRLEGMKAQLATMEEQKESTTSIGILKRRINSFEANLVEILVGGISETDRDSLRDLVEDAVLNCRSAAKDGFGFGANFEAFVSANYLMAIENKANSDEDNERISNFDKLLAVDVSTITTEEKKKELQDMIANTKYSMTYIILSAYMNMLYVLYRRASNNNLKDATIMIQDSIKNMSPFNIRTKEYDGKVLASIKSDQIILDAIGKIVSIVFETNQFLVASYVYNRYEDDDNTPTVTPNQTVTTTVNN